MRAPALQGHREIDLLAALAAAMLVVLGYLTRAALSPDGVSYLDLATVMQQGDWWQVVQGYWSPLLPIVTGAVGLALGMTGPALIPLVHALSTIAALGGLGVIWWWARHVRPLLFGRTALFAFLICSYGLPRIEAATPDVLLLCVAVWLSYELLRNRGERWLVVGVLFGIAFLIKTSAWPLLMLAVPLRFWAARDATSRRLVLKSTSVCVAVMALWIVPMSIQAGHPTLGSSGRLNFTWYALGHSSRTPDDDTGRNSAYQEIPTGDGRHLTLATYSEAARWTYQPWGDPTAWAEKDLTPVTRVPTVPEVIRFWTRLAKMAIGRYLLPLIITILLPAYFLNRRRGMWHELVTTQRESLVVIALGTAGILQFVAIHVEPRLIAPFAGMMALGTVHWFIPDTPPSGQSVPPVLRAPLAWAGVIAVVGLAFIQLTGVLAANRQLAGEVAQMRDLRNRLAAVGQSNPTIAVLGTAAPLMSAAYRLGGHIAAQVPPSSAALLSTLPQQRQSELSSSMFRGRVLLLWQASNDGSIQMWGVPPPAP